jgi:hypothetical protein
MPISRRLTLALLLSLLMHALLLSLTFGGQGLGLPGFDVPWGERRFEAPDLRVVLMQTQVTVAAPPGAPLNPQKQASIEQTVTDVPALKPSQVPSKIPAPAQTAEAVLPKTPRTEPTAPAAKSEPAAATVAVAAIAPPPIPAPEVIAVARSETPTFAVPPPTSAPPVEAAKLETARLETAKLETANLEAAKQEAARTESARLEAARVENAKQEATRQEAQRQEDARIAAAKLEAKAEAQSQVDKLEAVRVETAKLEAARLAAQRQADKLEAARTEAAKLEANRQETARIESAKLEAARLEAQRQEDARLAAAGLVAARALAEKEEDARREARRQAMGRVLNEEAAQREAAATAAPSPSTLSHSLSTARRVRLWGRTHPNAELVQYAEAWARKIQFNTPVETVRDVAKRPHTTPMVTVAIRSDGSVESVTFVLPSGVAEVDEAIRQIVQSHVHYRAFPPALAREVDVIEIRRTWHFDIAIQLY